MDIPFVDLLTQHSTIEGEVGEAIQGVLKTCTFIGGDPLEAFEQEFAAFCQAKYAVGVANGTDALHLALRALGIGAGDEVITAANSFIASVASIEMVGARPVLVDIDPTTYTLDPGRVEAAVTPHTRAILPVHLYGQPADMQPLMALAARRNLFVVEDAAQAHGAEYHGQRIGSIGHVGCFSFYPSKNLGAYGDGGAITTSDPDILHHLLQLRDHGRSTKYEHARIGYNSRLDTLQASILRVKLRHLDRWNRQRQEVAQWYEEDLAGTGLATPQVRSSSTHVYHLYVVSTSQREAVQAGLQVAGIATGIHYPLPLHLQPALRHLSYRAGDMPHTEAAAAQILSLPMFPELRRDQTQRVAGVIRAQLHSSSVVVEP